MNDEKLKIILALLSGIVFSLIFILLAFVLPANEKPKQLTKQNPKNHLEKISQELRK
ncbi:hypothetical protein [Sulfuricurvum sp.]|uniref:hypothetical protein n=1 Tax=Sulfuricurvum sp. TaxID=2025608 RepID=UPI0026055CA2|nr:hypothetical protein [Sulfuricurvum sp.]MDD2779910.1 hypothetical protein [Sulfuricurvum sp.]